VFFDNLDISAINAYALSITSFASKKKERRNRVTRRFLTDPANHMVEDETKGGWKWLGR
jgi:hypothetical protein